MKQNGSIVKEKVFLHGLYEKITGGADVKEHHYVPGPAGVAAIYEKSATGSSMFYVHTDHLGSVDVITNSSGAVVERMAFDPCLPAEALAQAGGQRRNATDWSMNNVPAPTVTERGYTMHEHLGMFGLINMNGRTYNPLLARFTGADPIIQSPANMQNYNSYSYVLNNPLMYTDPSGYKTASLRYSEPFSSSGFEFFEWGNGGGGSGSMGYSYDYYSGVYTDNTTGQVVDWQTAVYGNYQLYGGSLYSLSPSSNNYTAEDMETAQAFLSNLSGGNISYARHSDHVFLFDRDTKKSYKLYYNQISYINQVGGLAFTGESGLLLGGDQYPFPVAISIGHDLDIVTFSGLDVSLFTATLILRGQDSGSLITSVDGSEFLKAWGWDLGVGAEVFTWYYYGNIDYFCAESFDGPRLEVEGGLSTGLDLNVGIVIGEIDSHGGRLIGVKGSAGIGFSPFSSFSLSSNIGRSTIVNIKRLWKKR